VKIDPRQSSFTLMHKNGMKQGFPGNLIKRLNSKAQIENRRVMLESRGNFLEFKLRPFLVVFSTNYLLFLNRKPLFNEYLGRFNQTFV
jgi:hypothetical protein